MSVKFKKLTPTANVEKSEIYKHALDYVFQDNEICNVAISGIYGSGKSSVLESYKRQEENKRNYLHLSLASFDGLTENYNQEINSHPSCIETGKPLTNLLEGKIVNQLIHFTSVPLT